MSQEIYSGYGSYKELENIFQKEAPGKIFLITGKNSYTVSGAEKLAGDIIRGYEHVVFSDFEVNPKIEDIIKGVKIFKDNGCDFIVGIGGGSVIDIAKAVSILATQSEGIEKKIRGDEALLSRGIISLIIPTTAGTGSESTHFSVVYIGKEKFSLAHQSMVPDYAILDPVFTENLPPYITACTGMDALCQGIESFWSVNSTDESREYSRRAIELSMENLENAVNRPDTRSREQMLLASNYGGRAINISQTTIAHAVSYPITSFFNIPHGHAVALTLPYFIEYNCGAPEQKIHDSRGAAFVKRIMGEVIAMLGADSGAGARDRIISIMKKIKLENKFSKLRIFKDEMGLIVKNGFNPQRAKNNPVKVTEDDLRALLAKIK